MIKFPKTLEAAQAGEKAQWRLGDALVAEADEKNVGRRGLNAVAQELIEHGIAMSTKYLGDLRMVANAFPRNRRLDLPWQTHLEAGNPEVLDVVVRAAAKARQKITQDYVRAVVQGMRNERRAEREQALATAREQEAKAREKAAKARERERAAKEEGDRRRAERERHEAEKEAAEARRQAEAAKVAPKKKDEPAPREEEVSLFVVAPTVLSHANEAILRARDATKALKGNVEELSPRTVAGLTEAAMNAANAWTEVAALVRSATSNKRGHLSVVNE